MSKLIDIDGAKVIWEHIKAADAEISASVTTETERAKTAEASNASNITAETARAQKAEGVNAEAISAEAERAKAAESTNATAISDEVTRAKAAENTNATAISTEATRAKKAESANATAIKVNTDALGGHTVASDVPEGAVFTDTVYDDTAVKNRLTALEDKSTGSGKTYTFTDDTATDSDGNAQAVTVTKVNGHTVKADVPDDAKFTDTVTKVISDSNLREYAYNDTDAVSPSAVYWYLDDYGMASAITKSMMDDQLASVGISAPLTYPYTKMLMANAMANAGSQYTDGYKCVNVLAMAEIINTLCQQIDANTSNISGKADSATTLSGYGITDAYTKTETYTKEEVDAAIAAAIAGINTDTFHWDAGERTADTIVWGQGLSTGKYYTNFNANTGGLANGAGGSSVDSSGNVTVNNSTYYGGIFVPFEVTAGKTYKLTCDIPFGLLSWGELNSLSTASSGLDSPQTKPTHLVNNWSDSGGTQSFEITPTTPYIYIAFGNSDKKPVTWSNIKFVKK